MPTRGTAQSSKRLENHLRMKTLNKKLMNNPKWRNQHGIVIAEYSGDKMVTVRVVDQLDVNVFAEEKQTNREVVEVKPVKKKLTKEEKLALSKRLAGSARLFSKEGVEESLRIANRED